MESKGKEEDEGRQKTYIGNNVLGRDSVGEDTIRF